MRKESRKRKGFTSETEWKRFHYSDQRINS
jgi:hypothetical protein